MIKNLYPKVNNSGTALKLIYLNEGATRLYFLRNKTKEAINVMSTGIADMAKTKTSKDGVTKCTQKQIATNAKSCPKALNELESATC